MKHILTTSALTLALAMPAVAQNSLRADVENMLASTTQDVQVETLTDEQVRALYAALSSSNGAADKNAIVESIVSDSQYVMTEDMMTADELGGANNIRTTVQNLLDGEAIDADVDALTNAQVAALYLELTSGAGTDATELEAIING